MPRLRRYLPPLLILLPVIFICGKLLLTPVKTRLATFFVASNYVEIGWPWVFRQVYETDDPQQPGSRIEQVTFHSNALLSADVAVLLAAIAIFAALVVRKARRNWPMWQFSMRELLAATTVFGVACGWWLHESGESKRELQLVMKLEGCDTRREYCGPKWLQRFWPVEREKLFYRHTEFFISGSGIPPADAVAEMQRTLPHLPRVRRLVMHSPDLAYITNVEPLASIEEIYLHAEGNEDAAMAILSRIARLRDLTLDNGDPLQLSDVGLFHLAKSSTLETLYIPEGTLTGVTDEGIARLAKANRLRQITLPAAPITDAAIESLAQMTSLETLAISRCDRLTDQGLRRLSASSSLKSVVIPCPPQISEETAEFLADRIAHVVAVYPDRVKTYAKQGKVVECKTSISVR